MGEIYFSRHAKNRMRRFKIEKEEVIQVVKAPELLEQSIKGRQNAWRRRNKEYIRVTYKEEHGRIVIITVTLKEKRGREKGEDRI